LACPQFITFVNVHSTNYLVIIDLETNKTINIYTPEFYQAAGSVWSSDSSKFALITGDRYDPYESVVIVDIDLETYQVIIPQSQDYFEILSWANNIIVIEDRKYDSIYNIYVPFLLYFDITANRFRNSIYAPTP
jgi:hypothetical protein